MRLRAGEARELLRVTLRIGGRDPADDAALVRERIAGWLQSLRGVDLPAEAFAGRSFTWGAGGLACEAIRVEDEREDLWALRAAGSAAVGLAGFEVLEFTVGGVAGDRPAFSVRVLSEGGATTLRTPSIVAELAGAVPFEQFGEPLDVAPLLVDGEEDVEILCRWLCLPSRQSPVIVLSVPEDAEDPNRPLIGPEELARDVAGVARVAVLPSRFTWGLTQRFGKKLGVYRGAVRVYQPGFDGQTVGDSHWAVLANRLRRPADVRRHREDLVRRAAVPGLTSQEAMPFQAIRDRAPRREALPPLAEGDAAGVVGGRGAVSAGPTAAGEAVKCLSRVGVRPAAEDPVAAAGAGPEASRPESVARGRASVESGQLESALRTRRVAGAADEDSLNEADRSPDEGWLSGKAGSAVERTAGSPAEPVERERDSMPGRPRSLWRRLIPGSGGWRVTRKRAGHDRERDGFGNEARRFGGERPELRRENGELRRQLEDARRETESLFRQRRDLRGQNEGLRSENEKLEAERDEALALAVEEERAQSPLREENQRLRNLLRERGIDPDRVLPLPTEWTGFADWCDRELAGRLALDPRARRELKKARFADVRLAAQALQWLAGEYRDARRGGGDSRQVPVAGLRNERCGGDSFEFGLPGGKRRAEWHVKSGGSTRDPERCLRIYYAWDEESSRVIVASMPGHVYSRLT